MSKVLKVCLAVVVALVIAQAAHALPPGPPLQEPVPEIDPSMIAGAVTVLVGSLLMLAKRK